TRNFQAFIESLETGEDFWFDGREARKAVEVILAIYKSAKEQKLIKLT
ncbi:MAG: gfo/Idh/MocA family oxidoreductase, partial [Planctomycetes bacterium]|nr:gfo/Idh/MocA family oxidoreductase [Planctomycetota bacterium]